MQCSTASQSRQAEAEGVSLADVETWDELVNALPIPVTLEVSARVAGALLRRREVKCAADLLRMVLAYACCDYSLRLLGIWCAARGLGNLSHNALRKRLKHCNRWLGMLIMALLQARRLQLPQGSALRVRLQDATRVVGPGSQRAEWRVHLCLDVAQARMDGIEVTDVHGGETLVRFAVQPGEIRLGDRGYAHPRGLGEILAGGGQLVVRINWQNLPMQEEDGRRFDIATWLREIQQTPAGASERSVWLPTPKGRFAVRMVACPLPAEKAEEARRRARQAARKKKHNVDERTLLAAGFVLLVTNLPIGSWSTQQVLALYRLRWQVEILFKRLKSLLVLDGLRAQDPELAQTYLLAKLLGALMLEEMTGQAYAHVRADWDIQARPASLWRMTSIWQDVLRNLIRGSLTQAMIKEALPRLHRFLSDGPRKRRSQWAQAQALLHALSGC
jgi:hypothetical protein